MKRFPLIMLLVCVLMLLGAAMFAMQPSQASNRAISPHRTSLTRTRTSRGVLAAYALHEPYTIVGKPTIHSALIDQVLCTNASPACGTGNALYMLGVKYDIDPVFALAFFQHESTFGRYGMAVVTHSSGNIRCSQGYQCINGYRVYGSWQEGYEDWYRLIAVQYVQIWHLYTVAAIVRIYAPPSENDTTAYIQAIEASVNTWRSME